MAVQLSEEHRNLYPEGFLLSRQAWERYAVDAVKAAASQATHPAMRRVRVVRALAEQMNAHRDFSRSGTRPAQAGELLGMGALMDVLRSLAALYCSNANPHVLRRGLDWAVREAGPIIVEQPIPAFVQLYPPEEVRAARDSVKAFLGESTGRLSNREVVVLEMVLLRLSVENPALAPYIDLYDDTELKRQAPYESLTRALDAYLETQPFFPETGQTLMAMLRAPMLASPHSIEGQLDYVARHWKSLIPSELLERLELTRSILREETVMRGPGPGPLRALEFGGPGADPGYKETEAFSLDKDWMPNLVLIAKTVYVWLDQLSKKYRRPIARLDQIPDEELDRLGRWGFTGLWLIGLWERSQASQTIKRLMGNPEAESSAYSLYDYVIAHDLGGQEAYDNLAQRAGQRGIRLASDMVPNHVGIYSKWVVEHPDWFVQLDHPPFPSYHFTGPNLSPDDRIGLYLEDGYWEHRDAAVVFKRVDHATGETRYIYHGNDGTNMPWNDTAQLNFILPEVREAVIETILHVARMSPVIRFDAAMTLAKRHYQRLWFPKPGDGGAIPSRAEHGMSQADFDQQFPVEFWREVVDRVAAEAPDTLLLAEAFWLMEGYFVRTLGMHRVYNSAFMNMLKMEDNAKYRQTLKNVLEFSPEILKRFVNFMNNPDEDTAAAQFGKGDKYLGVAVLMATMPGLPMFGHGQIEGFAEKYGMEYRRAYWEETVDEALVARHERGVFPLMRKRHLFSGARHFALFDFVTPEGWVNENVFAYTNRLGDERALIVYNNAYETARGVIHTSTAINEGSVEEARLHRKSLAEALGLDTRDTCYYVCRDQRTGLEYLHHAPRIAEKGLHLELRGYEYNAMLNWRCVHDLDHTWGPLDAMLGGRGVPSIEEAYREMHLTSILEPFQKLMNRDMLRRLAKPPEGRAALGPFRESMAAFLEAIGRRIEQQPDTRAIIAHIEEDLVRLWEFPEQIAAAGYYPETVGYLRGRFPEADGYPLAFWRAPLVWCVMRRIGAVAAPTPFPAAGEKGLAAASGSEVAAISATWLHEWLLVKQIARAFRDALDDAWLADMDARLVRICVAHGQHLLELHEAPWGPTLDVLFRDPDVWSFLHLNHYDGKHWINREQLDRMLYALFLTLVAAHLPEGNAAADALMLCLDGITTLLEAAEDAGYDLDRMIESLR